MWHTMLDVGEKATPALNYYPALSVSSINRSISLPIVTTQSSSMAYLKTKLEDGKIK